LIKFVVESKIIGVARTKIGCVADVNTIAALTTLLNEKCGQTETQASLLKKLNDCKQGTDSVDSFAEQISNLTDRLTALEVKRKNLSSEQEELVREVYEVQALSAFKRGLNTECQQAVCASRPDTLQEAIQVASEIAAVSVTADPVASVYNIKQIKCFKCNKNGHKANDCWMLESPKTGRF
jgi:predicted RNase H-like nuclease (RuvC/YqgF family)